MEIHVIGSITSRSSCWRMFFLQDLRNPPKLAYSAQTNKDSPRQTTQSGPDSQIARSQALNTALGCNAVRSLHRSIGFAI